jgi:hypothetical protein
MIGASINVFYSAGYPVDVARKQLEQFKLELVYARERQLKKIASIAALKAIPPRQNFDHKVETIILPKAGNEKDHLWLRIWKCCH